MVEFDEAIARTKAIGYSLNMCVAYSLISTDGEARQHHQSCFSAMMNRPDLAKNSDYVVSLICNHIHDEETVVGYLDYLMHRSGYQDGFLEKDAQKAFNQGATIHTLDCPGNMLLSSMASVRMLWENSQGGGIEHAIYFKDLVASGCSEDWAYVVGWYISKDGDNALIYQGKNNNHNVFSSISISNNGVVDYLNHKPKGIDKSSYRKTGKVGSMQGLYSVYNEKDKASGNFYAWLNRNVKKASASSNKGEAEYVSPWPVAKTDEYITYTDLIKILVDLEKVFKEEFVNA